MSRSLLALCFVCSIPSLIHAAGYVDRNNFVIVIPAVPTQNAAQRFAEQLHERAEYLRNQIAHEWLGAPLPDSIGRTVIHVDFSDTTDMGLTWAKDNPRRTFHNVYLKTSSDRALSSTLAHELTHVVLATEYPHEKRLAAWVEEGIASQYDDAARKKAREEILAWYSRTGNWPSLLEVMESRSIGTNDKASYAVAASLAQFLIDRRSKQAFVKFASEAQRLGWEPALREHYGIQHVAELETMWRAATTQRSNVARVAARR